MPAESVPRPDADPTQPARIAPDDLPIALEPIIRRRLPAAGRARITGWTRAPHGYSTETYLFEVTGLDGPDLGLVLRRPPEFSILPDFDLRRQYLVMQRLAGSPVPVPTMRWIETDPTELGTPYFVMDRLYDVETVSDVPPYHESGIYAETDDAGRAAMWNVCVDVIADIHAIDPARYRLGFLDLKAFGVTPPERLANFLRYGINWATGERPIDPRLLGALDWLDQHLYVPNRVGLCWGDARMSNVLYRPDRTVAAALDWEISYLGDPAADLAWMFMSDWVSSPLPERAPAPGTPSREETLERYRERTGHRLGDMRFSDVTAALLLAVPLIRLTEQLGLDVDLGEICAQRVQLVLES